MSTIKAGANRRHTIYAPVISNYNNKVFIRKSHNISRPIAIVKIAGFLGHMPWGR